MLQTWLDASDDFRFFSLAGYVASESNWEEFSTEWKKVLDLGEPPHEPIACFKMSQMDLKYPAHIERCGMLYSVIEKFVDAAISVSVKKEDLFRALDSFKFPKNIRHTVDLRNPYYWAFSGLIALLLKQREQHPEILNRNPHIFLDHQEEKARCIKGWEELKRNTP